MLRKKTVTRGAEKVEDVPIDFPWLFYIGMNKLGFSCRECGWLYFGQWNDLFDVYKRQYNFEQKRMLYKLPQQDVAEPISSLDVL